MDLALLHREPPIGSRVHHPVWRTCLREIEFLDRPPLAGADSPVIEGAAAYRLLLEVICGLRSPLLGETQVQGQFRAFLSTLDLQTRGFLIQTGQRLLTDARAIREAHLRSLGNRSYGAAIRHFVRDCRRVAIVGAGALATDVLSYVEAGRVVDRWVRRRGVTAANRNEMLTERLLDEPGAFLCDDAAALVVAAPVPDAVLSRVASRYPALVRLIDLRGEPASRPLLQQGQHVTLRDVFARAAASVAPTDARIAAARHQVQACAARWAARVELHPFGWDDLCA